MKSGLTNVFGLISVVGSVAALPQASVTLWDFGLSTDTVFGTEWAEPIGTASDGSVTTFILENVAAGILSSSITSTETVVETVMVSASGWDRIGPITNIVGGTTVIVTDDQCFFTDSTSGACVEEGNINDGPALTEATTGPASAMTFAISTGVLPGATTTAVSQTTVSTLPTSLSQSTVTVIPTQLPTLTLTLTNLTSTTMNLTSTTLTPTNLTSTPLTSTTLTPTTASSSPTSATSSSSTTSSNAASSTRMMEGNWNVAALAAVGGMLLGASLLF